MWESRARVCQGAILGREERGAIQRAALVFPQEGWKPDHDDRTEVSTRHEACSRVHRPAMEQAAKRKYTHHEIPSIVAIISTQATYRPQITSDRGNSWLATRDASFCSTAVIGHALALA